jgi:hypothetical protein
MSATYSHDEGISKKENRNKTIKYDTTPIPAANRVKPSTEKAEIINTPKVNDNVWVQVDQNNKKVKHKAKSGTI